MTITFNTSKLRLPTTQTLNKAISSALNKTVVTAKKEMSSGVREIYNLKKKDLDPKIHVKKASMNNTSSTITVRSSPIGMIHFNATATKAYLKGRKTYYKTSAKILKKERKKVYRGVFIGKAKNSNSSQVFRRSTKKRLPLKKMSVITPTSMVKMEGLDDFIKVIQRDFNKNFNHEFSHFLGKQK